MIARAAGGRGGRRLVAQLVVEEGQRVAQPARLRLEPGRGGGDDVGLLLHFLGLGAHLDERRLHLRALRLHVRLRHPQRLRALGAVRTLLVELLQCRLVPVELGAHLGDLRVERVDLRLELGRLALLVGRDLVLELRAHALQVVHLVLEQHVALIAHGQLRLALAHLGPERCDRLGVVLRAHRRLLQLAALGAQLLVQLLRLLEQVLLVLVRLEHNLVQLGVLALVQLDLRRREASRRREPVEEAVRRRAADVRDIHRVDGHAAPRPRRRPTATGGLGKCRNTSERAAQPLRFRTVSGCGRRRRDALPDAPPF